MTILVLGGAAGERSWTAWIRILIILIIWMVLGASHGGIVLVP